MCVEKHILDDQISLPACPNYLSDVALELDREVYTVIEGDCFTPVIVLSLNSSGQTEVDIQTSVDIVPSSASDKLAAGWCD